MAAKKGDKKNGSKRVLFELFEGMNKLRDSDGSAFYTKTVQAFFGDLIDDEDESCSSSDSGNSLTLSHLVEPKTLLRTNRTRIFKLDRT